MNAAILIQTGFLCDAGPSAGLYPLVRALSDRYPDRRDTWIGIRTHDAKLDPDVAEILGRRAMRIVHIGHSYGDGHGLLNFAGLLRARRREIDLACLIDPVPDVWGWRELIRDERPFPVPQNVRTCMTARTLNKAGWFMPWGRPVAHPGLIRRVTFTGGVVGSDDGISRFIPDPTVHHDNIDHDHRVHDEVLHAVDVALSF